ncbi:MAG TPA: hypothetical protein VFB79_18690 [Candidatus Angelobacter sp.]|nr:hypothetical protein [Candidatus Angelobacter sp.]
MKRPRYIQIKLPFHRMKVQDFLPFQIGGNMELILEERTACALANALLTYFLEDCAVTVNPEVTIQQFIPRKTKNKNLRGGKRQCSK